MAKRQTKRGQGEGCITKRKDGSWAAVITVGRNPDGSQKRRFFYGKSRAEVADKLNKAIIDLKTGVYVDPNKLLVSDWLKSWLFNYKTTSLKPKTLSSYDFIIQNYLNPAIGGNNLQDLKTDNVQLLINKLFKRGLSPRTIKYTHIVLHSALDQALKNNLVVKNVSDHIILPKQVKNEKKVLTLEEQNRFLSYIEKHRLNPAFVLLLSTGLRIGELLALRWKENIDLENGTINVTQNLQRVKIFDEESKTKTKLIFGTPKTDKGKRQIPLLESVIELLKQHNEKILEEKNKAGKIYTDEDLVFCTEIGTPIEPRNFSRTYRNLMSKAGVSYINIHSLRHTFATRGLESGIDLKIMQELLGHSSISITGDIYSHVLPDKKRESINKLKDIFKSPSKEVSISDD